VHGIRNVMCIIQVFSNNDTPCHFGGPQFFHLYLELSVVKVN
jgi:hypothetical protein